jgi:hypothetical protein
MRAIFFVALACFGLGGCVSTSTIAPTAATESQIKSGTSIEGPASVSIPPGLATYSQEVSVSGFFCDAWSVPVSLGPGLVQALDAANHKAFHSLIPAGSGAQPVPGAKYNVAVSLEGFHPHLSLEPGLIIGGSGAASAEIDLRIQIADDSGKQLLSSVVAGDGESDSDVFLCSDIKKAISQATSLAIQQVTQNYLDKITGSGVLQ